ncbi:hypothetical protein N431DRAFT_465307 [Stipitochalara longipes BDJ]|nr:hypothetical protein N431DRAFT_465307 [Stipitochalara longipes BDJ]
MADYRDLYTCDGCSSAIITDRARVSCHSCANYHLCANCFIIKQFSAPHLEFHSTMIFELSGFVVPPPPGFNRRPPPPLPPRTSSTTNIKQPNRLSEIPTASWKSPQDGFEIVLLNKHLMNQFSPARPKSVRQKIERVDSTAPSYPQPAKWETLFENDETPTSIFIALISTIFSHLDPRHTGYLTPEIYSGILDVQGYPLTENIWKMALEKESREKNLDLADLELGLYLSHLDIPHTLAARPKFSSFATHNQDQNEEIEPSSAVEDRVREGLRFGANMPMLSRQGFIDLAKREYLGDPEVGWVYLKRVRDEYGIWNELGEMPRSVLPESRARGFVTETIEHNQEIDEPALPPRSKFGNHVKVNGGEKKVEDLLNGPDWQKSPPQNIPPRLAEATDTVQEVNILLQKEDAMRAKRERKRDDNVKPVVEELEKASTEHEDQKITAAEVEMDVDRLMESSVGELDGIPAPIEAGKGNASLEGTAGYEAKTEETANNVHSLYEVS